MTTVRQYESGDKQQLYAIAAQNYAGQQQGTGSADPDDPAVRVYLEHIIQIQESGKGVILIAEQENELVGFVCLLAPESKAADKENEPAYAFMSDLFVVPACRNKGVGSLLTENIEAQACAMGADHLALRVAADSTGSRSFYAKNRYQEKFIVMSKELSDQVDR